MQRGMSVTLIETPKTLSVQIPELEMWCQWKTKATKSSMRTCFNYMGTILLALGFMCTILLARARAYQILKQSSFQGLDMGTDCTVWSASAVWRIRKCSVLLQLIGPRSACSICSVFLALVLKCVVSTTNRNSVSVSRVYLYVCVCILCFCNSISLVLSSTSVARAECSVSTTDGASIVTLGYKATRGSTDKR